MTASSPIRLEHPERCIGCYSCVFACSLELFNEISAVRSAVSLKPCSPAEQFVVSVCANCDEPPCARACKPQALQKDKEGKLEMVKPAECDKCETFDCIKACVAGALSIDQQTGKPILCTLCGKCAEACPHEVITCMEKKE
jgi:Fe-S-cluster-containing dehydrogenase component